MSTPDRSPDQRSWTVRWRHRRTGIEYTECVDAADFEGAVRAAKRAIALRMDGVAIADIEVFECSEDFI